MRTIASHGKHTPIGDMETAASKIYRRNKYSLAPEYNKIKCELQIYKLKT